MNAIQTYNKVFCDTFGIKEDVLGPNFTFRDVPVWDSVAHLSLISNLEDAFDVMFDADDILHYGSYLNGIEILKRYGVDFA